MLWRRGPSLVVALTLLLTVVLTDSKQRGRTPAQKAGRDPDYDEFGIQRSRPGGRRQAPPEQADLLPDRSNKDVARELRCSLCVATVDEVWNALPRRKADGQRPKQYEIEDVLEDLCTELEKCARPGPMVVTLLCVVLPNGLVRRLSGMVSKWNTTGLRTGIRRVNAQRVTRVDGWKSLLCRSAAKFVR